MFGKVSTNTACAIVSSAAGYACSMAGYIKGKRVVSSIETKLDKEEQMKECHKLNLLKNQFVSKL